MKGNNFGERRLLISNISEALTEVKTQYYGLLCITLFIFRCPLFQNIFTNFQVAHTYLTPLLRMTGAVLPLPLYMPSWCVTGQLYLLPPSSGM